MEDPECVRCSACVQQCPTGVLAFGRYDGREHHPRSAPGLARAHAVRIRLRLRCLADTIQAAGERLVSAPRKSKADHKLRSAFNDILGLTRLAKTETLGAGAREIFQMLKES